MQSTNYVIKALAYGRQVRAAFAENTELVRRACRHPAIRSKLSNTALGSAVSAASLLTATLKDRQRISLKIKASNPAYHIFADADSHGNVRGYASEEMLRAPAEWLERTSIADWIGDKGCIQVVKDIGMNRTFTGITDMPNRNIADDLSHYYRQSEQTLTRFALHLSFDGNNEIRASRGIFAQLLPGAGRGVMEHVGQALERLTPQELDGGGDEALLRLSSSLFDDTTIIGVEPVRFFCGCSKEMLLPMLAALGTEQLRSACEENRPLQVFCHICGTEYAFSSDEIGPLYDS
ncbi:Hsp33 family molecular chaperone HslO [Paenibacillaceae bacterium WGS1546]|uniref:Hsp33 family molecular chaperone HslO n=1 Tax=Cohnella sp. WGS1546 TaxID=3366810 RepID=UPI00372D1C2A